MCLAVIQLFLFLFVFSTEQQLFLDVWATIEQCFARTPDQNQTNRLLNAHNFNTNY